MSKQPNLKQLWNASKKQRVAGPSSSNQGSLGIGTVLSNQASLGVDTVVSNRCSFVTSPVLQATLSEVPSLSNQCNQVSDSLFGVKPIISNRLSLGARQLATDVFDDCVMLQVKDEDLQEGNQMSPYLNKFIWEEHIDSCNMQLFKFSKSVSRINPDVDGFEGVAFDKERQHRLHPESRPLSLFCDECNITMAPPFVKVYAPSLRSKGSCASSYMDSHRDKLTGWAHNGIEPFVRVMYTRYSSIVHEMDADNDVLYKKFEWKRRVEGSNKYDEVSMGVEDGDVILMGSKASGKLSSIHHQPLIQKRDSISFMYDLILPRGSEFESWTIPEFGQLLVDCDVFAGKDHYYMS